MPDAPYALPADLPEPVNDGMADHLPGHRVPSLALPATNGDQYAISRPPSGAGRLVLYAYPRTGRPGEEPLAPDWELIPGARGCTPEACGFRDHSADLQALGAAVAGLSTQDTAYQAEAAARLNLTFPLLSDADLRLTSALRLPTFEVAGLTLLKRLTMIIHDEVIEHVFYPVFPPGTHAMEVVGWLRSNPLP